MLLDMELVVNEIVNVEINLGLLSQVDGYFR